MKDPRNQLVLLGFVCQALSWDEIFCPILFLLLWAGAIWLKGKVRPLPPFCDFLLLVIGSAAALFLGRKLGINTHFFIGHGLVLVQCAWLIKELTPRERTMRLVITLFHLAVGCTFLLDLRFIGIFLAAAWLLPRALMAEAGWEKNVPSRWKALLTAFIVPGALVFYFIFPRTGTLGQLGAQALGLHRQSSMNDTMDAFGSSSRLSDKTILQVRGRKPGYFRAFALVNFDGQRWHRDTASPLTRIRNTSPDKHSTAEFRLVRVKDFRMLRNVLPADGTVVGLEVANVRRAWQTLHGTIETEGNWNGGRNEYRIWINEELQPTRLSQNQKTRLLQHPQPTAAVAGLVERISAKATNDLHFALLLEDFFQREFTYLIGAPRLQTENALEEFLFSKREGHCERFASAMAVLLRIKGIPSRVMVGYVPGAFNRLTGSYVVRVRDAHAWTEAFIPEMGWVRFDATPRSVSGYDAVSPWTEGRDWLEELWLTDVLNFGSARQQEARTWLVASIRALPNRLAQNSGNLLACLAVIPFVLLVAQRRKVIAGWKKFSVLLTRKRPAKAAEHWHGAYGDCLRTLARSGWSKDAHETPWEFFYRCQSNPGFPADPMRVITGSYCEVIYGRRKLNPHEETAFREACAAVKTPVRQPEASRR